MDCGCRGPRRLLSGWRPGARVEGPALHPHQALPAWRPERGQVRWPGSPRPPHQLRKAFSPARARHSVPCENVFPFPEHGSVFWSGLGSSAEPVRCLGLSKARVPCGVSGSQSTRRSRESQEDAWGTSEGDTLSQTLTLLLMLDRSFVTAVCRQISKSEVP